MSSQKDYANQAPGATGVDPEHPAERGYRVEVVDADAGVVRAVPAPRKKIAICGFAASSRNLAPFDDTEYEIWGLNQLYRHVPRMSREFDVHANWKEDNVEGTDHPGWLAKCGIPVYMSTREPSLPTAVTYPLARVIEKVTGVDYFTSTVAFMVGLAIAEIDDQVEAEMAEMDAEDPDIRPDGMAVQRSIAKVRKMVADAYSKREIGIFGIDLIVGTEYDFQKSCVEYLLGLANARGIVVRIPPQCALLRQRWRYGYEVEPASFPIKPTELEKRGAALDNERAQLIARLQTIDGARQENSYWQQVSDLRIKGGTVRLNEASSS